MNEQKFYRCKHCGNFVGLINNAGEPLICCGDKMEELIPNTVDASKEKHVPEVTLSGDTVTVKICSVEHPMEQAHHIEFIYINTAKGGQRKSLKIGDKPVAVFKLYEDTAIEAFAYCNLHGLWRS